MSTPSMLNSKSMLTMNKQAEIFTRNYLLPNFTDGFSGFAESSTTTPTTSSGFFLHENSSSNYALVGVKEDHKMKIIEEGRREREEDMILSVGGKKKKKGEKKVKRPRFAFQTRSQVDILDDGYRWRKYGQKAVKNNKFPRSYYRCTHPGCSVKKQVQRLSKDEGIVVTTYEGMHTHPTEKNSDNFEQILSQMKIYSRP